MSVFRFVVKLPPAAPGLLESESNIATNFVEGFGTGDHKLLLAGCFNEVVSKQLALCFDLTCGGISKTAGDGHGGRLRRCLVLLNE